MKKTAVEFLVEQITNGTMPVRKAIEQAKAMEEKNLKDSFIAGAEFGEMFNNKNRCYVTDAKKYLKTFKSE